MSHQLSKYVDMEEMLLLEEPNPILPPSQGGTVRVVPDVTILPRDIVQFSKDYILVLSGIEEGTQSLPLPLENYQGSKGQCDADPLHSWEEKMSSRSVFIDGTLSPEEVQRVLGVGVVSNPADVHALLEDYEEEGSPLSLSRPLPTSRLSTQRAQPNNPSNVRKVALHRFQIEQWEKRYRDLVRYDTKYGHSDVPHDFEEDPGLLMWVKRQRKNYKDKLLGRPSSLTDERFDLLNKLNFEWDIHARSWLGNYNKLLEFHKQHGTIKLTYLHDGSLRNWVKRQKRLCRLFLRGKKSCSASVMTTERFQMLSQVGLFG